MQSLIVCGHFRNQPVPEDSQKINKETLVPGVPFALLPCALTNHLSGCWVSNNGDLMKVVRLLCLHC